MANTAPNLILGEGQLTYGVDGLTITPLLLVPLQNGGVIVVGEATGGGTPPQIVLARFNSDGSLDSNFIAGTDVFGGKTFNVYDAVEQPDGDILVGGTVALGGGNYEIGLVRYHSDGSLDTSFGSGGSTAQFTDIADSDGAVTLTLQGNGQILVGGLNEGLGPLVARFNANGTLDTSFGSGGAAYHPASHEQFVTPDQGPFSTVLVRPDGHILGLASVTDGDGADFVFEHELVQFNSNGTLDTSFGTNGHAFVYGENFQFAKLDNSGKILVGGVANVTPGLAAHLDGFIARYNADGSLDTSFGQGGIFTLVVGQEESDISDFVVGPDGKILFTGTTMPGSTADNSVIGRLNADGSVDSSFGANGTGIVLTPVVPGQGTAGPIAIDGSSKIFQVLENGAGQVVVQSSNPDGTLNHTFNPTQTYVERSAPIVLEPKASIYDAEDDPAHNYAGASVTLMRHGGASADDVFGGSGSVSVLTEGQALEINGFSFGTVTKNSGGVLTLTFNANADQSVVDLVLTSITYANTSHNPPASVQIDWTFSDGGSNGAGAPLSDSGSTLVNIVPVNDLPVVSTSPGVTTETEHTPVIVDADITVDDVDNTTLASATVAISNYADGDVLAFKPDAALFGNIQASYDASIGALSLTSQDASATLAQWQAALRSVTYNTTSLAPDTTPRQIQFFVNDGLTDSDVSPYKLVEIQRVNDPPVLLSYQGAVFSDFGGDDTAFDLVLQPNGDAVVLGGSFVSAAGHNEASLVRFTSSGGLDQAFGSGAKVLLGGGNLVAENGGLEPDGKIVVLTELTLGEQGLARFNTNGTLDTSFGSGGTVALPTDDRAGIGTLSQESLAVQSDGKIVVAAQSYNGGFPNFNKPVDVLLLRYNLDGTLDTTFGNDGVVRAAHRTDSPTPSGVAVDADGKIVVTVQTVVASGPQYLIERYNSNGTVDTSFGNQGIATSPIQKVMQSAAIQNDVLAPVILSGGKLLVASSAYNADRTSSDIDLVRYNHDGSVDSTFGGTGTVTIDLAQYDEAKAVVLQSDGKILVLGSSGDFPNGLFGGGAPVPETFVMRFLANGSIDTSFGIDGKAALSLVSDIPYDAFTDLYLPNGLQVSADGKILISGTALHSTDSRDVALVRLNADGSLDSTLGGPVYDRSGPSVVVDSNVYVSDPELQASGNYAGASLTLARHGGASADDVFGVGGLASITGSGDLVYAGVVVGSASQGAGALVLTFNAAASESIVQSIAKSVTYANTAANPPSSVQIDWTINDGNSGAQGIGGPLSTTMTTEIGITGTPAPLVIPDGGTFTVAAGQTLQALSLNIGANATLDISGTLVVQSGGASGTVSNSGTIEVAADAKFSDDLQNLAGASFVNSGTTADMVTANAGTITNTTTGVWNGDIAAGANGSGGDIINQGVWNGIANNNGGTIENAGSWNGAIIDTAGTFTNTGSIDGSITIGSTATFALQGTGSISNFSPVQDAGTLDISGISAAITHIVDLHGSGIVALGSKALSIDNEVSQFTGTFTGGSGSGLLVSGADIDLSGAHFTSWNAGQTISLTGTGDAASLIGSVEDDQIAVQASNGHDNLAHTIDGGGGTNTLKLSGKLSDYSLSNIVDAEHFTITDSVVGRDGVDILSGIQFIEFVDDGDKVVATDSIACYCPGTLILTDEGEVPVQDLVIGDKVVTASGAVRPIKWIGRRAYGGRFLFGQKHILPVCIRTGALHENTPRRDLWISPHHAMYLDGMLIEARDLVNGVSIVQAEEIDRVDYFHIELDSHDVIVAEGAWSETFVDDDSRGMFHNAHEYALLYPHQTLEPARYCAPRIDEGFELEAARRQIAARAGCDGPALAAGPLRGHVDALESGAIEGWAQSVDHPEIPVCLDIVSDGKLIGRTLANRYREDLRMAGIGSGHHSFRFEVPAGLRPGQNRVEVRRSLDGRMIA